MKDNEVKLLYKVYKEFYKKEPDFSNENRDNITIEMQAMAYLLGEYGISLGDYRFEYNILMHLKMPISMHLQDILVCKMLEHENKEFESDIPLNEMAQNAINVIGESVTTEVNKCENQVEALRLICSVYYVSKSMMSISEMAEIVDFQKCSPEEVENAMGFVRTMVLDHVNGNPGL